MISRFYLFIWFRWVIRVVFCSVFLAAVLTSLLSIFLYFYYGATTLQNEVYNALLDIFGFYFSIFWSFTLLVALFRSLKYIYNTRCCGYEFRLYGCQDREFIEKIRYSNLIKVWRKWFSVLIWIVSSIVVVSIIIGKILFGFAELFEWFNIYWLGGFTAVGGYFSFIFLPLRCKQTKVVKC